MSICLCFFCVIHVSTSKDLLATSFHQFSRIPWMNVWNKWVSLIYPDAPCIAYLPTCSLNLWYMQLNIRNMEHQTYTIPLDVQPRPSDFLWFLYPNDNAKVPNVSAWVGSFANDAMFFPWASQQLKCWTARWKSFAKLPLCLSLGCKGSKWRST